MRCRPLRAEAGGTGNRAGGLATPRRLPPGRRLLEIEHPDERVDGVDPLRGDARRPSPARLAHEERRRVPDLTVDEDVFDAPADTPIAPNLEARRVHEPVLPNVAVASEDRSVVGSAKHRHLLARLPS